MSEAVEIRLTVNGEAVERRVPYEEFEAGVEASAAEVFGW